MNYKDAKTLAESMDKSITLNDLMEDKTIRIIAIQHEDGSYLEFHSAVYRSLDDEWFVVYTEHHGDHVYNKDDVKWVKEWKSPGWLYQHMDDI